MWYRGSSGRMNFNTLESSFRLLLRYPSSLVSAHLLVLSVVVGRHGADTHDCGRFHEGDLLALDESWCCLPQNALGWRALGIGEGRDLQSGVSTLVEEGVACRRAVDGRRRDGNREWRLGSGNDEGWDVEGELGFGGEKHFFWWLCCGNEMCCFMFREEMEKTKQLPLWWKLDRQETGRCIMVFLAPWGARPLRLWVIFGEVERLW